MAVGTGEEQRKRRPPETRTVARAGWRLESTAVTMVDEQTGATAVGT
jgi:hypothetical protein